ncbi:MAG: hypothetical protein WC538_10180 [Thermoanaerobaculia bacterium]
MSELSVEAPRNRLRLAAAIVPLALIALSLAQYGTDRRLRRPVEAVAKTYTFEIRRPAEVEMIGFAPSPDFGAQVVVYAAIVDALARVRLKGLDQVERDAWLDVPVHLDGELAAARELALDSIAQRPGWPIHRYLLGKVAYTRDRRTPGAEIVPDRWLVPLRSAARSAPGFDSAAETLVAVTLEAWATIPPEGRRDTETIFSRAFLDPSFVRNAWAVSANAIGVGSAVRAVPDSAVSLRAAARAASGIGEAGAAEALYRRWERAEWVEREADIAEMRRRTERGDWSGLVAAAQNFSSRHSAGDFDGPEARKQLEEALRLWPRDSVGNWAGSRRAEIIRFFLDGRMKGIDGTLLAGAASSLAGVPFPMQARLFLAAGLVEIARELEKGSMTRGSFEWTDYYVELARYHLARNDRDKAAEALGRIAPGARGECEAALAAALLARVAPAPQPVAVTSADGTIVDEAWSTNGMLSLCIDPRALAKRALVVDVKAGGDGLVEWGWNDARSGTVAAGGGASIRVPLAGIEGREVFFLRPALGASIVSHAARIE